MNLKSKEKITIVRLKRETLMGEQFKVLDISINLVPLLHYQVGTLITNSDVDKLIEKRKDISLRIEAEEIRDIINK